MRATLEDRWFQVLAETNDQRRCVGQALHYLHRTLLAWRERGKGFAATVAAWAPGAAALFASLEGRLRRLPTAGRDVRLRKWLAPVLRRLGEEIGRGDRMVVPFARWLEARFPELTTLMKKEAAGSKIHDADLARDVAVALGACARAEASRLPMLLAEAADELLAE